MPGVLIDVAAEWDTSDDEFDRHGRIRRRVYPDTDSSDSDHGPLVESPVEEVRDHTEELLNDPGPTSSANGDDRVSQAPHSIRSQLPLRDASAYLGGNSLQLSNGHLSINNIRIFPVYDTQPQHGFTIREFILLQITPLIAFLRTYLRLTSEGPTSFLTNSESRVLASIAGYLQIAVTLSRRL